MELINNKTEDGEFLCLVVTKQCFTIILKDQDGEEQEIERIGLVDSDASLSRAVNRYIDTAAIEGCHLPHEKEEQYYKVADLAYDWELSYHNASGNILKNGKVFDVKGLFLKNARFET
jgi:hypothetical protein